MPQIIDVPGHGRVEFPDGMSDDQIVAAIKANSGASSAAPQAEERGMVSNIAAGAASGVADLGDTILNAAAYLPGKVIPAVKEWNDDRSASLQDFNKAHDDSTAFKVARVGGNIAATAPVGGVIGAGVKALSAAPIVQALGTAIGSGGFKTGAQLGTAANLATRAAGGAVSGGASAGLIDPGSAGEGALIGGAIPGVAGAVGELSRLGMKAAGTHLPGGAAAAPSQKLNTARAGAAEGYVVPPIDLQPGMVTQLLSGLSGKIKTSQVASQRNQTVSNDLARRALGMQPGEELTADTLNAVRARAGQAYDGLRTAGAITSDPTFLTRMDQIAAVSKGAARSFPGLGDNGVADLVAAVRQPLFDAGDAIDATKVLREMADKAFRGGDTATGRAAKAAATALEDQMERHLTTAGNPQAVKAFQDARKLIAQSYTVQAGLNPATGNVSAQKLAQDLNKGKPLSGDLALVGRMGQAFPKATQALKEAPGAVSPLDWMFSGGAALGGGGPLGAAMLVGRPAVRQALLSKPVQAMAMRPPSPPNPALQSAIARALSAAPVLLAPGASP